MAKSSLSLSSWAMWVYESDHLSNKKMSPFTWDSQHTKVLIQTSLSTYPSRHWIHLVPPVFNTRWMPFKALYHLPPVALKRDFPLNSRMLPDMYKDFRWRALTGGYFFFKLALKSFTFDYGEIRTFKSFCGLLLQ